jgi:hypothetical protein
VVPALQERAARYRLNQVATRATAARAAPGTLDGTKCVVPAGDEADAFIVPARWRAPIATTPASACSWSPRAGRTGPAPTHAGRRPRGRSALGRQPATLITTDGLALLQGAVDIGIAAQCAEAVGLMDGWWPSPSST